MKKNYLGLILNFLTNNLDNAEYKDKLNLLYEMNDSHMKWSFVLKHIQYHFHIWKIFIDKSELLYAIYKEKELGHLSMPLSDNDIRHLYNFLQEQYDGL